MTPEIALQIAVVDRLKADSAVAALVTDRVWDEVPTPRQGEEVPVPYVYIGPIQRTRVETDYSLDPIGALRMRLYAVSTNFGRVEAWEVANAVAGALEGFTPSLSSPYAAQDMIRAGPLGDVVEPLNPKSVFVDITVPVGKTG